MYGMTEMIANHISCRAPGSHDHFLINPYGMLYEEIDASCLIKVDLDGNVLFNASDYGVNAAGFVIHRDRKSTRLNSSHTVISYAVFCLKKKKKMIYQYAMSREFK